MIQFRLHAFRHVSVERLVELLFHLGFVVANSKLPPAESVLAGQDDSRRAFYTARFINGEVGYALYRRCGVHAQRRICREGAVVSEAETAGEIVFPPEEAEWAHLLTGIEIDFFSIEGKDRNVVV